MALFNKKPATNKKPEPEKRQETAAGTGPKEVQPVKKKRKMRYLLLYIAAIGFAFYAVITIINQNVKIAEKRAWSRSSPNISKRFRNTRVRNSRTIWKKSPRRSLAMSARESESSSTSPATSD